MLPSSARPAIDRHVGKPLFRVAGIKLGKLVRTRGLRTNSGQAEPQSATTTAPNSANDGEGEGVTRKKPKKTVRFRSPLTSERRISPRPLHLF